MGSAGLKMLLVIWMPVAAVLGQKKASSTPTVFDEKVNKVRLVNWKSFDCDNTYDPYRLVNRITSIERQNGHTLITVNFSDNCCAGFKPNIQFKDDKLFLQPYEKCFGDYCSCNCCFSIQFEINGLAEGEYNIYFKGEKIVRSDDHYQVFKMSQEEYNGTIINRRNKYGFQEGMWMIFYENGKSKEIDKYPDNEIFHEPRPIWSKKFYPSGSVSFYSRKDTVESWFEDGQLKSQTIKSHNGDTTYTSGFVRFDNHQLERKYKERIYPTTFLSEFDPDYRRTGSRVEVIYEAEFFDSGKKRSVFGKDTSYSWYESGQIESIAYRKGGLKYDKEGLVIQKAFYWKQRGPSSWGDLGHSLYVDFTNRKVSKIEYVRDEATKQGVAPGVRYNWAWSNEGQLIESPKNWKAPLPWKEFHEIEIR